MLESGCPVYMMFMFGNFGCRRMNVEDKQLLRPRYNLVS